jgi:hypothetical protein
VSTVEASFGRVDESGNVFVIDGGVERLIGSQPEMTIEQSVALYTKRFQDLADQVRILEQRVKAKADPKSISKSADKLLIDLTSPAALGDFAALRIRVTTVKSSLTEALAEASAKQAEEVASALAAREVIAAEAEKIAALDPQKVNYKSSGAKMTELFTSWQDLQKNSIKLPKAKADEIWHRFSKARNTFDSHKRSYFAAADAAAKIGKRAKLDLVTKAESLVAKGAEAVNDYKDLLTAWKALPKAKLKTDDAHWARFKAAGDAIYAAKSLKSAADDVAYSANLAGKLALLEEAEKIDPTANLEAAKAAIKSINARWEKAGKVPREQMRPTDDRLKAVEAKIRKIEEELWRKSDPATIDRTNSLRSQLEVQITKLEAELEAAKAGADSAKIAKAQEALDTKKTWLEVVLANS